MELYFLGTGAGMPSRERNVTSIALTLFEERGTFWLFDCGEGTQHQIMKSPLKASKLEKLFVTHLHGDHIYGIPGLLASRSSQGGDTPLTIYGPKGIRTFVETVISISEARMVYPLEIVEIAAGMVWSDLQFSVSALQVDHRIECFGYRIEEAEQPGTLLVEKLRQVGIPSGPVFGKIKSGSDVTLADGTTLVAKDFVGPAIPGRILAICGDTKYTQTAIQLAQQADVLVHEATFDSNSADLAEKYFHSTAEEAARIAEQAEASALILTHISSRYQDGEADQLLTEARGIFPNTYMAHDFWSYLIAKRKS